MRCIERYMLVRCGSILFSLKSLEFYLYSALFVTRDELNICSETRNHTKFICFQCHHTQTCNSYHVPKKSPQDLWTFHKNLGWAFIFYTELMELIVLQAFNTNERISVQFCFVFWVFETQMQSRTCAVQTHEEWNPQQCHATPCEEKKHYVSHSSGHCICLFLMGQLCSLLQSLTTAESIVHCNKIAWGYFEQPIRKQAHNYNPYNSQLSILCYAFYRLYSWDPISSIT